MKDVLQALGDAVRVLEQLELSSSVRSCGLCVAIGLATASRLYSAEVTSNRSQQFNELTATAQVAPDVRIHVNAPEAAPDDASKSTRVIVFALPNGNTLEQTLGCKLTPGLDWQYDIQHIAAQTRLIRTLFPRERIVLICAEAKGLSWPAWRAGHKGANATIARLVDLWRTKYGSPDAKLTLTGHSGGGGFMFSVIEAADDIPAYIDRMAFLDANYNFDAATHAEKITRWLNGDSQRRLIVLAYDDRNIQLKGKRVVGPTGGTFRATARMVDGLSPAFPLAKTESPPFTEYAGLDGRIRFYAHTNPNNKILHTALVGDMNGLVHIQTLGTPAEEKWGKFAGPRAYSDYIQPEPTSPESPGERSDPSPQSAGERLGEGSRISLRSPPLGGEGATEHGRPEVARAQGGSQRVGKRRDLSDGAPPLTLPPRPATALTGSQFAAKIASLDRAAREAAILREILAGNFPDFERKFLRVPIAAKSRDGQPLAATLEVAPDMLAVGSDADFLRIPMRPETAQKIADAFGCVLPTRKMVDAIDAAATVRLAPQPLTENRELVAAFVLSNGKIEEKRNGQPLGQLVTGAKKDIVISGRIHERPHRLVIYGWRKLDGQPIQPLTNVHVDWYVDYSHGVRLVSNAIKIDGRIHRIAQLLRDPTRCNIVSDEGVIDPPRYPLE